MRKEKRMSSSALLKKLVGIAEKAGGWVSSRETTPGACKVWMDGISPSKFAKALRASGVRVGVESFMGITIYGDGFEASRSGGRSRVDLFIACYRSGEEGERYSYGIDG